MGDHKIKTIAVSGAGGFVGSHLTHYFNCRGAEVIPLSRRHFTDEGRDELTEAIGRSDAIINLAGAPINHRWTDDYKVEMYDSRINTTRRLVDAIRAGEHRPQGFCSASAVGYYSDEAGIRNTETDFLKGSGFLAGLCEAWEREALRASDHVRTAVMRFGLVLSPEGGVLKLMELPTLFKFAASLGDGRQFFPWIDIRDLAGAADFIMKSDNLYGVFNFTAPQIVTNREFTRILADRKHSWFTIGIPRSVFKTVLGEASSFVLSGQSVIPKRLREAGYDFISPDLETFFETQGAPGY